MNAARPRTLIVVTHLLGVGHLARMAAVGRALAAQGWPVALVSGGRPVATVETGGCELIQLPPIHCTGTDFSTFHTPGGIADAAYMERRRDALLAAFETFAPDVLVTELYPFGRRALAGEFEALLARAMARAPRPLILSSVRDVLNPPSRPEKILEAERRLAAHYDGVLFHGDDAVVPLGASWPVGPSLARRLLRTGYVHDGDRAAAETGEEGRDEIVVSGGGSAASLPLCRAAIEAAGLIAGRRWRLLVGHGVPAADFTALVQAAPANMVVERARPDFPALLARAALSVSQAGYNTVLDLAAANARAVLVPFAAGNEREQGIRAGEIAARGLARIVPEAALTGAALAVQVRAALEAPRPDWSAIHRDGAARAAALIVAARAKLDARQAAWCRLDAALAAARAAGRTIDVWLRDDDAVTATPALDAFLARAARWGVPVALASIPARADPALAARLAGEPSVDVLVHGWAHDDHAPRGAKKAEFDHRPLEAMLAEARAGLARGYELFGDRLLPVFVPPWNRFAPALAAGLSEAGFTGLSAFANHPRPLADKAGPGGLDRIDTHWDPIAWREGGGLADEVALIDRFTALIGPIIHATEPGSHRPAPVGLLTHHLVHDAWIDAFLDAFLGRLNASGAVRFRAARELFGPAYSGLR